MLTLPRLPSENSYKSFLVELSNLELSNTEAVVVVATLVSRYCLLGVSVTLRTLSPVAGQLSLLASKTLELDGCLSVVRKGRQDGKQLSDMLKLRSGWWVRAFFFTANSVN